MEALERKGNDLNINIFQKQAEFLGSTCDDVLFGGAAGGGKSHALLLFSAKRRMEHPGSAGIIFRRTFPELDKSIIRESLVLYPMYGATYNSTKRCWTFPNGSIQEFSHCERDGDVYKYQSAQYADACFDELTHFTEFQFSYLTSRVRTSKMGVKPLIRCATNPGNVGHCVREGEVLTPTGWKDIRDFKVGDRVYSVNKDGHLYEALVDQVHQSHYSGDLISLKQSGFNLECTPNHSVAKIYGKRFGKCTRDGGEKWSLVPFDKLPGQATILRSVDWTGNYARIFTLPAYKEKRKTRYNQPDSLDIHLYGRLMGWFLSEGHIVERDKAFGISQMKEPQRDDIRDLLNLCNFAYSANKTGFLIYSAKWWNYLKQFGKCTQKFIPTLLKNSNRDVLAGLFCALVDGDGHWVRPGLSGCYYTISKALADDVCEIAVKLGFIVDVKSRMRKERKHLAYEVFFKTTKSGGSEILTGNHVYDVETSTKRRSRISRIPYSGPVYCIGVPDSHSFVIRQKGSVWVSGNSWVYKRYIEPWQIHKIWKDEATGKTMTFIPAKISDNPALETADPGYIKRLRELPEKKYLALAEGRWDVFEGAYFTEFDPTPGFSVLTKPWDPTPGNIKFLSLDWGFSDPAAIYWFELSPYGRVYMYRELYVTRLSPKQLARTVLEQSPKEEEYDYMMASPEIWGKKTDMEGSEETIRETMQEVFGNRILMEKANNARVPGWLKMREYLSPAPDGRPWMLVSPVCTNFIRTVPTLIHSDKRPEDIDDRCEDHCAESARYGLVSLSDIPRTQISPHESNYDRIFGKRTVVSDPMSYMPLPGKGGY